jgi:hypothetical protein
MKPSTANIWKDTGVQHLVFLYFLIGFLFLAIDIRTNIYYPNITGMEDLQPVRFFLFMFFAVCSFIIICNLRDYWQICKRIFFATDKFSAIARHLLIYAFAMRYIVNFFFPLSNDLACIYKVIWITITVTIVFCVLFFILKIKE